MLSTPILFIVFNRPQNAQRVFDRIRQVQPKYLFVAADGPRHNKPEDVEKCADTRKIIEQIDWDCELKTLFRDENRGCGYGPAEAITWFFEYVDAGIILEDDCLPSLSFFPFCAELLEMYKEDRSIFMISGTNPLSVWKPKKKSYFLSKMGGSWGWATWKRAWQYFDHDMKAWYQPGIVTILNNKIKNKKILSHLIKEFEVYSHYDRKEDVWDYQWLFSRIMQEAITIVPSVNLISNIGFGEDATHTKGLDKRLMNTKRYELTFPLQHPSFKIDRLFDWIVYEKFTNPDPKTIVDKLTLKALKLIYRFKG